MSELLPCPMCGSPAMIDSTGAAECYGWNWQTVMITCTDVHGKHCGMSLDLQADMHHLKETWEILSTAWNSLAANAKSVIK